MSTVLCLCYMLVICSRNRVPRFGCKIPYTVPNPGNYYPVFRCGHTKYHQFRPVFAFIHDIKQYCSFNVLSTSHSQTSSFGYSSGFTNFIIRLLVGLHKLHHSVTRRASQTSSFGYSSGFTNFIIRLLVGLSHSISGWSLLPTAQ